MARSKKREKPIIEIGWEELKGGEVKGSSFNLNIRDISPHSQKLWEDSLKISSTRKDGVSNADLEAQTDILKPDEIRELITNRMAEQDKTYYKRAREGAITPAWRDYAVKRRL